MNKIYFKNYGLEITLTPFQNIIGLPSSGKTSLLKGMINQIKSSDILIDDKPIKDYSLDFLRQNIAAVLNDFIFKTTYVKEELLYYQKIIKIDNDIAYENIEKFTKFFELEDLLDSKIEYLTIYEKAYVKILSLLIIRPSILGIDDVLTYLSWDQKLKIMKYASSNNVSIINVTSNPEELLLGTDIIILDKGHVIAYDTTEKILENEKNISKVGMHPPFIVEMSTNLNYYDLLKKKYFDMASLVGELWK